MNLTIDLKHGTQTLNQAQEILRNYIVAKQGNTAVFGDLTEDICFQSMPSFKEKMEEEYSEYISWQGSRHEEQNVQLLNAVLVCSVIWPPNGVTHHMINT